jgi:hypothetical protein
MDNFESTIKLSGMVEIKVFDEKTGRVKHSECRKIKNVVVTTGAAYLARRAIGTSDTVMNEMRVGTSNAAAAIGQTALSGTLVGSASLTATATAPTNIITYQSTFAAGNATGAIQEAGIFNASNVMLARTAFSVVNKSATDAMAITWNITVAVV